MTEHDPIELDPTASDPTEPDPTEPDPTEPDATASVPTVEAGSATEQGALPGLTPPPDLDQLPGGARAALEAILMVVDRPVDEVALASALALPVARVSELLTELVLDYDAAERGFELRRVAGGWRFYSRPAHAPVVERFVLDGQTSRLSQAALETLAIVAYRQPVSRARVSAVRGVNVDAVMRTLVTRGLVEEAGNDRETGAVLYRTTELFLHKLGLTSLDELPALAPFLPEVDALDDFPIGMQ
jgi:segregation and condensation protein B